MTKVPGWLLRHTVTVEAYEGTGGLGELYGPPTAVRCLLAEQIKTVRDAAGQDVTSGASYIADPAHQPQPLSRVTLPDGRQTVVITIERTTAPGLPVPANTRVYLE